MRLDGHTWVGGMCYLDSEDVLVASAGRDVECERCGVLLTPRQHAGLKIQLIDGKCDPNGSPGLAAVWNHMFNDSQ